VDLLYQANFGEAAIRAQLLFGGYSGQQILIRAESDQTWGGNVSFIKGALTLSLGVIDTRAKFTFPNLAPVIYMAGNVEVFIPAMSQATRFLTGYEFHYTYWSGSLAWEPEDWLVHSEVFYIGSDDPFSVQSKGAYVSIARPIEYLTPYFVLGYSAGGLNRKLSNIAESIVLDAAANGASADSVALGNSWAFSLDVIEQLRQANQNSYAVGVRYDIAEMVDIKFELLLLTPRGGTAGQILYDGVSDSNVRLYSIVLDAIF
jgi:hypothetical protein